MLRTFFVLSDQQMFTASQYEFRSFPDIRRNSPSPMLRTEDAPTRWLNGELKIHEACSSSQVFGHPAKKQLWTSFSFATESQPVPQSEPLHHFLPHTEADFVGSALVRESAGSSTGDDDKIYFFFTERSQEQTTTYSHSRVARVARICKVSTGMSTSSLELS